MQAGSMSLAIIKCEAGIRGGGGGGANDNNESSRSATNRQHVGKDNIEHTVLPRSPPGCTVGESHVVTCHSLAICKSWAVGKKEKRLLV